LILGVKAKERLTELLRAGPVTIERHDRDRFHRTLAYLRLGDGRRVGDILLAEASRFSIDPAERPEKSGLLAGVGVRRAVRLLACCAALPPDLPLRLCVDAS
jgi:hypothetical protein